jgi:HSP20 family protein
MLRNESNQEKSNVVDNVKLQDTRKMQEVPVKVYRSADRLMVALPMPGLQPEDIDLQVNADGLLSVRGELRGLLKDIKQLLVDEWSIGAYYRELSLPDPVDAVHANATYGNGVLVITFPLSQQTTAAELRLTKVGPTHGEYVGHSGHSGQLHG